jgi:hypothetical protein
MYKFILSLTILFFLILIPKTIFAAPSIGTITNVTSNSIPQYEKYENSFSITTNATNPYFPYDPASPPNTPGLKGITVDMLLLKPGQSDWVSAQVIPCFYYQPIREVVIGGGAFVPTGLADWRCRFSSAQNGDYSYKIRATDATGTSESGIRQFTIISSLNPGYIRISQTDSRYFEFSNGQPFIYPLVNVEEGNPFNTVSSIRTNIQKLGTNGVKFVRWFPTGEGANYMIAPYGDDMKIAWMFGPTGTTTDIVDSSNGKQFSFAPYYYSSQAIPLEAGKPYKASVRAYVSGEKVLRFEFDGVPETRRDICSTTSTQHEANGFTCFVKTDGWHTYEFNYTPTSSRMVQVGIRGLYANTDAPEPFNVRLSGAIRIHSVGVQEMIGGSLGGNLLYRGDPETQLYIDQIGAARLDELFKQSEQYGVYHKLPLFEKNDAILNSIYPDGTIGEWDASNFYKTGPVRWYLTAYVRYFMARWSYSPTLHSVELANENGFSETEQTTAFVIAEKIKEYSVRPLLQSNSFWGWWVTDFWKHPTKGYLMDYADQHWYANQSGSGCQSNGECILISKRWDDSVEYARECYRWFNSYKSNVPYDKPMVRGEGGNAVSGVEPQNPDIGNEPNGIYYHKKLWAHVGIPGYSCDGDWYPRLFVSSGTYPNASVDTLKIYKSYARFMENEPINNDEYEAIGSDIVGGGLTVATSSGSLRAYGVKDRLKGNSLVWIDNAKETWKRVFDAVLIQPASGTVTFATIPAGAYRIEWWDTGSGTISSTESRTVGSDGHISVTITNLNHDIALKIINTSSPTGVVSPTSSCGPVGDIDCNGTVNLIDLSRLLSKFGQSGSFSEDIDHNGIVNLVDLSILLSNFGKGS